MLLPRAILIVGSLLSLCLSDSVGPRLLPLGDGFPISITKAASSYDSAGASHAPAPKTERSTHIAMASASQYRSGEWQQESQSPISGPEFSLPHHLFTVSLTFEIDVLLRAHSDFASIASSRAPPRLF